MWRLLQAFQALEADHHLVCMAHQGCCSPCQQRVAEDLVRQRGASGFVLYTPGEAWHALGSGQLELLCSRADGAGLAAQGCLREVGLPAERGPSDRCVTVRLAAEDLSHVREMFQESWADHHDFLHQATLRRHLLQRAWRALRSGALHGQRRWSLLPGGPVCRREARGCHGHQRPR